MKIMQWLERMLAKHLPEKTELKELWGMKPEAILAFEAAWAPVKRRETASAFKKTSKGAGSPWFPGIVGRWINLDAKTLEPVQLRRLKPKREAGLSHRQWKRSRMAALRCA